MGISLRPHHLKRYKDLAHLLIKYGRSDLVRGVQLDGFAIPEAAAATNGTAAEAEELVADLERMGPTFVKLGQVLSSRPDLLPASYIKALARLQDSVEPFGYDEVEQIVTRELGIRLSKAFVEFDPVPLGAASLGQVHRALLRGGKPVVVKVQRPGIRQVIADDLAAIGEIVELAEKHTELGATFAVEEVFEEFRKALIRELDYRQEAQHLAVLGENLREFERIVVPAPVDDYTTSRVLTMDFIRGKKITSVSPMRRLDVDGEGLADDLFRAYLKQILVDGFFHADPHPGNVFLTDDGRLALIDLGMIGRIGPKMQEELLKMVLAISEGKGDDVATIGIRTGEPREDFEEPRYRREVADLVATYRVATARNIEVGKVVLEVSRIAGENGIRPSTELSVLGKALLNLDQVGRTLSPDFDPNAAIRRHAAAIMEQRLWKNVSPGNVLSTVLEMNELVQTLPGRVNQVLETVANNKLEIRIKVDEDIWLMETLRQIANRITLGLVLAGLIVGAALMMRVDTAFRILGYPGIAIIFFLIAAVTGLVLVFSLLRKDGVTRKGNRHHPS